MTLTQVMLNDCDLRDLGFMVLSCEGWRDIAPQELPAIEIPGLAGQLETSGVVSSQTRELVVSGTLRGVSVADCQALYVALVGRLTGLLELTTVDAPTLFTWARLAGITGPVFGPQFDQPMQDLRIRFRAADPRRYQKQPSVRGFGPAPRPMAIGPAPVAPILEIGGGVTNPVITYRNSAGTIIRQMSFTAVLAATDYLWIDCLNRLVIRYNSGVATTGSAAGLNLMDVTSDFIKLDPSDGDIANGVYPTLEVSGGVGCCRYRKAWP